MDSEACPVDGDPLVLGPALRDLCRALDSLRTRLRSSDRAGIDSPATGHDVRAVRADSDPRLLGIVQELLASPSADLPAKDPFAAALDRASRWLGADRIMLFVAEADGTRLVPRAAHGFRKEDLGSTFARPGEGMIGRVFRECRVVTHPAIGGETADAFIDRFPVSAAMAVPIRGENDVSGVLYVGRQRIDASFSASDMVLLLVIADRVGGLVRQAVLDGPAKPLAPLAAVGELAGGLSSGRPLADVLGVVCEAGRRLVGVSAAAVTVEAGPGELELVAARGLPASLDGSDRVSAREGVTAELYGGSEFVVCRDLQARRPPERSFLGRAGFRGCVLMPLRCEGAAPAGVLYLAGPEVRGFSAEEIEAARLLAAMAAAAIRGGHQAGGSRASGALVANDPAAQIEKARALGEMASGLARELNNIFAIILGKSRLLLARTNNEPLREGLARVEEAAWRGADVVHRMMALGAPASDITASPVDLVRLVRDVITLTQPRWREADASGGSIDVVTDLHGVRPVHGSEPALREMLVNLVLNAVDAMAAGGRLTLSTRPRDDGVELIVEDTGEGISEEVRGRVFDAFFTTRSAKRMGLGLTVAQGVIVRHGGWIELTSFQQKGTRVTVWLPATNSLGATSR